MAYPAGRTANPEADGGVKNSTLARSVSEGKLPPSLTLRASVSQRCTLVVFFSHPLTLPARHMSYVRIDRPSARKGRAAEFLSAEKVRTMSETSSPPVMKSPAAKSLSVLGLIAVVLGLVALVAGFVLPHAGDHSYSAAQPSRRAPRPYRRDRVGGGRQARGDLAHPRDHCERPGHRRPLDLDFPGPPGRRGPGQRGLRRRVRV